MKAADYVTLLRVCSKTKDLQRGIALHDDIVKRHYVEACSDALVIMYAKCGRIFKAEELLVLHKCRSVAAWTALIAAYVRIGQGYNAVDCYDQMRHHGISPDAVAFVCVLKACASTRALEKGLEIHEEIISEQFVGYNIMLGNALVDMYAKCGAVHKAHDVLKGLPSRNVITWNALITGYAQGCKGEQALLCFEQMQCEGVSPDAVTFTCILKACGCIGAVEKGEQIHDEIVRCGYLKKDLILGTALVDMYAKCGAFPKAHEVLEELPFRNEFCWSALISGYAEQGYGQQALLCYEAMKHDGLSPCRVTYLSILKACGSLKARELGEQIHEEIGRQGLLKEDTMLGNALIDMYTKCGTLSKAEQLLDELSVRDVVSWSTLIAGYSKQGQEEKAFISFERMQDEGITPNVVTFACILKACGSTGANDKGEKVHEEIIRQGLLDNNLLLGNTLVDMYSKCGALGKAQQVMEELSVRDDVTWNTLIAGFAQHGQCEQALSSYEYMQQDGFAPGKATFLCLLKACGCIGAFLKGEQIHEKMTRLGLSNNDTMLSTALVDMYAKCGALEKAYHVLRELPVQNEVSYSALLGACERQIDVKAGRWAFEHAVQANKNDALIYAQMANIYAAAGMQEDAELVEVMRLENEAW
ncbi:hypothetical protein KP509_07G069700 [Ceratopteris richardii]|uniref:Pentatricopeptide repeat-containing protein n=1 Tax=Ceratopteris richardii TaxID=49495 RepID=A0A8T2UIU0_CERRI|nr:hypothetical protein KP509_07G069700 [Ceratopteris richardii]